MMVLSGEEQLPANCREITPVKLPRDGDIKLAGNWASARETVLRSIGIQCHRRRSISLI